jgi:hypothetical protein
MKMILKCAMGKLEEEVVTGHFKALSTEVQYQENQGKLEYPNQHFNHMPYIRCTQRYWYVIY